MGSVGGEDGAWHGRVASRYVNHGHPTMTSGFHWRAGMPAPLRLGDIAGKGFDERTLGEGVGAELFFCAAFLIEEDRAVET